MSKPLNTYYEATKYLGQFIGDKVKFLELSACMDHESRKKFAILYSLDKEFRKVLDTETYELLKTIIEPLIMNIGYARWPRDTVTDMALKKGLSEDNVESFNFSNSPNNEDGS